jgi:hypothetical protein
MIPGINLTEEVKDLYNENLKTLIKEMKDTERQKDLPCSWIRRINILSFCISFFLFIYW